MIGLIHTCTVLTEGATGLYDVTHTSGLRCRLRHLNSQPGATGPERAELGQMRRMVWDASPALPEACQIVTSEGVTYNPIAGTFKALHGPSGAIMYRSVDVMRAVDG